MWRELWGEPPLMGPGGWYGCTNEWGTLLLRRALRCPLSHGTGETIAFVIRLFEWAVGVATFLPVLSLVPRHCARLTYFLHPKLRQSNAVLISAQPMTLRLRCAGSVPSAIPGKGSRESTPKPLLPRAPAPPGECSVRHTCGATGCHVIELECGSVVVGDQ